MLLRFALCVFERNDRDFSGQAVVCAGSFPVGASRDARQLRSLCRRAQRVPWRRRRVEKEPSARVTGAFVLYLAVLAVTQRCLGVVGGVEVKLILNIAAVAGSGELHG